MKNNNQDKLVKSSVARKRLGGISRMTYCRWEKSGKINSVVINGQNYMHESQLDSLLDSGDGSSARIPTYCSQ